MRPECSEQEAEWMTGSESDMLGLESWVECQYSRTLVPGMASVFRVGTWFTLRLLFWVKPKPSLWIGAAQGLCGYS